MAQNILEIKPNKITTDLTSYNFLVYAQAGMGKTTWATKMFPERALIMGGEFGYKGIAGAVGVPIPSYLELLNYVEQLDTDEARAMYDTLIIDTTTKIGEMLEVYVLSIFGKDSLGECKAHGGAYPLINRYYNLAFDRLKARGYNFVYVCHSKTIELKDAEDKKIGEKYEPKMSNRISDLIEPEVDYTFYLTLDKSGKRIMVTDNTVKSKGKQRTPLPVVMPLDIDKFKEEFAKGVALKGGEMVTEDRVTNTVTGFKKDVRSYTEVVDSISKIGKELMEISEAKGNEAMVLLNNRLGTDKNDKQQTLKGCTQENLEMLETIEMELKKLM